THHKCDTQRRQTSPTPQHPSRAQKIFFSLFFNLKIIPFAGFAAALSFLPTTCVGFNHKIFKNKHLHSQTTCLSQHSPKESLILPPPRCKSLS
ncbi:hypothetical protein, partial [Paraprevotella clara]|uniref:hypothetical protein n=1 Tax=Paraprevotella clara TaxID=454154 RepID=UPI003FD7F9A8